VVISRLIGGLGNQMFQYAAGFALARRTGQIHCLDVSDFEGYYLHQGFELDKVFRITSKVAKPSEVRDVLGWRAGKLARRVLSRPHLKALRGRIFFAEPHFNYSRELLDFEGDRYISGYWQSERYFSNEEDSIRTEFTFKKPLVGINAELNNIMTKTTSVSVHVRRGDYLSNSKNHGLMHVAEPAYYQAAISSIVSRVKNPEFYVFSDDMTWAKENIVFDFPCTYVNHNSHADSYIDMQLMSKCQHHIIANSSFSWWGAWLNPNTEKIVLAPKLWFRNGMPDQDLIPSYWTRL
jgi:Glycosyl transferase family 11